MLLLAQTVSLDLGSISALAVCIGGLLTLGKLADRWLEGRLAVTKQRNGSAEAKPAPPCVTSEGQNIICNTQHTELLSRVGTLSEALQRSLRELSEAVKEGTIAANKNFESISFRQVEIKTSVGAIHDAVMRESRHRDRA